MAGTLRMMGVAEHDRFQLQLSQLQSGLLVLLPPLDRFVGLQCLQVYNPPFSMVISTLSGSYPAVNYPKFAIPYLGPPLCMHVEPVHLLHQTTSNCGSFQYK